ncbi:MAG: MmgE/PrpD family protein [Alphaproteobacteria bacterium]|nr:MmgE/PrpD family protein [Alphaproteobacteria bacterium]
MTLSNQIAGVLTWLAAGDPLADSLVAERSRLLLLDTLGCAIAGGAKPELQALHRAFEKTEPGVVAVPGGPMLAPQAAAFVTALAACWDEACEGLIRAHGRPGLHAFPPALALGASNDATLGDVARATIAGYEVGGRLGEVMRIKAGMHVDGTWGLFAATTAASVIDDRGVHPAALARAIGIAACQMPFSLYRPVAAGATARNTYVAHAAAQGIALAQAAAAGVSAPEDGLDVVDRLALGGDPKAKVLCAPGTWLVTQGYLKPFAAVRHVHYGAAAAQRWRDSGGDYRKIRALRLEVYEESRRYCGNRAPKHPIQAQFSLTYGLAHTLVHGDLAPEAYTAAALADPRTKALEAMVEVETEPVWTAAASRGARLHMTDDRGDQVETVTEVLGDPTRPMSRDQVVEKFRRYASPVIGEAAAGRLIARVIAGAWATSIRAVLADARPSR